ncbi:CpsD/CapB family tyrosine-protein kinase [Bacillus sp. 2205SS5-2]|uniref:CpsD/CapB family tyrosine-protein kinase n=1 Tax=Bacillus sp. 2205SS5-2 TaxID=3109031 RepID=UPI0030077C4A
MNKNKRNIITHLNPKSPISEQYKTIRTNIQYSVVDQEVRSIMVTSSGPGEGKSTTIANLAVVFAQQGKKVLMIDADMRKPTAHYTFNLTNTVGLTNVLTKQVSLREAAKETDIKNLDLLPCGPTPPNPAELLSSKSMENFLKVAYEDYDLLLFDTPPLLAVTDAQVIANQVDGTILVVSSGGTNQDALIKAKELLVNAKAKVMGVVLNNRSMKDSNYYYYYGNN